LAEQKKLGGSSKDFDFLIEEEIVSYLQKPEKMKTVSVPMKGPSAPASWYETYAGDFGDDYDDEEEDQMDEYEEEEEGEEAPDLFADQVFSLPLQPHDDQSSSS